MAGSPRDFSGEERRFPFKKHNQVFGPFFAIAVPRFSIARVPVSSAFAHPTPRIQLLLDEVPSVFQFSGENHFALQRLAYPCN